MGIVLVLAIAGPPLLLAAALFIWRLLTRDRRRDPVNFKVLNLPGDGLRRRIAAFDDRLETVGLVAITAGPVLLAVWAISNLSQVRKLDSFIDGADWIYVALAFVIVAGAAWRFIRLVQERRRCVQGLQAELATAQNLIPLMAEGCQVFHDFPGDGFNIDHVIVGPNAVFAVETKSRKKPATGGREAARVVYDGRALKFPDGVSTDHIEQARRQAQWLAKFLAGGAGDPVPVVPVLALPGWYVELTREGSRADVIVNNLRSPLFLLKLRPGVGIDPSLYRRVAHALTERYPRSSADV